MNRIAEVLKKQGRSQSWLAEEIDKNRVTVSGYCRNTIQPSLNVLIEIAKTLGVDPGELIVSETEN
tara:strand:+ start:32567 stop:32764 length:198 start_codon:yes stop_codon:yes gene_type:complete